MNQLLTGIDGVGVKKNVFVIRASNQQEFPDLPARQGILDSTLKKSPEGFSVAVLAGVCQYAAKAGILDAIAAEGSRLATMPWMPMASARSSGSTSKMHTIALERQCQQQMFPFSSKQYAEVK